MRVIVTGGAGYVGARLVPKLLERRHDVTVVDKLIFGTTGIDAIRDRIDLVTSDVRRVSDDVIAGADAIIHLAGLSNDPTAEYNLEANKAINLEGTLSLARRAKRAGVRRFVFASSCAVYYTLSPDDALCREEKSIDPQAPYSWSKYHAELGLRELADDAFSPVILRKGTVFGQSDRMRYDLVVNTFTKDAFAHKRLVVHAGGRMWRPMLDIEDAANAYVAALEAPASAVHAQVFNVLSSNITVLQIATVVKATVEKLRNITVDLEIQEVGTARSYRADPSRLEQQLDLRLRAPIEPAVRAIWNGLEAGIDSAHAIHYNIRWLELLCDFERRLAAMGGTVL